MIVHDAFTLERRFAASPQKLFDAFATRAGKEAWFGGMPGYTVVQRDFDVRPGGQERLVGRWDTGNTADFSAQYLDVSAPERLVYVYEMKMNEQRLSFSLVTVEVFADRAGSRLKLTEQGAFYVTEDTDSRRRGTEMLMERLRAAIDTPADG